MKKLLWVVTLLSGPTSYPMLIKKTPNHPTRSKAEAHSSSMKIIRAGPATCPKPPHLWFLGLVEILLLRTRQSMFTQPVRSPINNQTPTVGLPLIHYWLLMSPCKDTSSKRQARIGPIMHQNPLLSNMTRMMSKKIVSNSTATEPKFSVIIGKINSYFHNRL